MRQTSTNPRQLALLALQAIHQGKFADAALDRVLQQSSASPVDRRLITELVYGCVRRSRTLDTLIDQLATKPAAQQPPNLRLILHLGLYQLRYLSHIPAAAAVDTSVELAKQNGLGGLSGFVNGLLRRYLRQQEATGDPLKLPPDPVQALAVSQSFPDWIVQVWVDQWGLEGATQLCEWMNQSPHIDLRINPLVTSRAQVAAAMQAAGIAVQPIAGIPQGLRLPPGVGAIQHLPGFAEGWWTVQDASAQLVGHLLDPQPGETVIDACAAPGGKTMHLAELMGDRGTIWACDRNPNRLKKLEENIRRLHLRSIHIQIGDSRDLAQFTGKADRVLVDAPCSGLGTLHRHADARWRQTPENIQELARLQTELLDRVAAWVKPYGVLVYSTCTLHPLENEGVVQAFLRHHPDWSILPINSVSLATSADCPVQDQWATLAAPEGWLKIAPHQQDMDGFFMVRLQKQSPSDSTLLHQGC